MQSEHNINKKLDAIKILRRKQLQLIKNQKSQIQEKANKRFKSFENIRFKRNSECHQAPVFTQFVERLRTGQQMPSILANQVMKQTNIHVRNKSNGVVEAPLVVNVTGMELINQTYLPNSFTPMQSSRMTSKILEYQKRKRLE